nr:DUF1002 domain-containing protein [uncultured Blautia sp.]
MMKMKRIAAVVVAGVIACSSPVGVMASSTDELVSQAEDILKSNEIDSLASDPDKVTDMIIYVKNLIDEKDITEDQISEGIDRAEEHFGVSLSQDDKDSMVKIINKMQNLNIDESKLRSCVSDVYSTLEDMGVTKDDVKSIFRIALDFVKSLF